MSFWTTGSLLSAGYVRKEEMYLTLKYVAFYLLLYMCMHIMIYNTRAHTHCCSTYGDP